MPGTSRSGGDRSLSGRDATEFDGLPMPAADLNDTERQEFGFLLTAIPSAILRRVDGLQLSHLARLIVRERTLAAELANDPGNLPLGRAHMQTINLVLRMSASFGLTPFDRQRLQVPEPQEEDPFDQVLRRVPG